MHKVQTIAIFGGGNGAFCHAADLTMRGFKVNLCEVPELAKNLEGIKDTKTIHMTTKGNPGMKEGPATVNLVTTNAAEALKEAQVALVVIPAFAQSRFAEFMAGSLREDQVVVLEPGNFGGSLEFAKVMMAKGKNKAKLPILMEFQCMIYSGWKDSPNSVWVGGFKNDLRVAAFPNRRTKEGLEVIRQIFPKLVAAENVFETGLSNPNMVFHAPMLVCNAGWCERTKGNFMLYWDGCTKSVGNLVQSIDDERMAVGKAYGMDLENCRDMLIRWYGHQGANGETLQIVMSTNPAYEFDQCPSSLRHRYFLEDIPYGMIPLRELGKVAGVPTPNTNAIIQVVCTLLGEDLEKGARDLKQLGLTGLDVKGIKRVLLEGF